MAAVLDAGPSAFLSGPASAALWRLSGFGLLHLRDIDVSRPRGGTRRPSELASIHEVLDLEPDHVTVLDGIPVSTPTRTVFELAATLPTGRAERAVDSAWARNLTSYRLLHQMLDDWADRGRAGTVAMREILERRPAGYVPPASNLESRFAYLADRHCIGPFRRQVNLGGEEWIGRVDFLHAALPARRRGAQPGVPRRALRPGGGRAALRAPRRRRLHRRAGLGPRALGRRPCGDAPRRGRRGRSSSPASEPLDPAPTVSACGCLPIWQTSARRIGWVGVRVRSRRWPSLLRPKRSGCRPRRPGCSPASCWSGRSSSGGSTAASTASRRPTCSRPASTCGSARSPTACGAASCPTPSRSSTS